MKKYLINQDQLDELAKAYAFGDTPTMLGLLKSLKPIEPMSDEDMAHIIEHTNNIEGQYFLPFSFAREIERHILGRETP